MPQTLSARILTALVISVLLAVRHYSELEAQVPSPKPYNSLELAGRVATDLDVQTIDGKDAVISISDKDTLLYVITPNNGFCARNLENMLALWNAKKDRYRFVAVSLRASGLSEDPPTKALPFEVFVFKNHRDPRLSSYGFGATPALYLIGAKTKTIQRAWGGALAGGTLKDAETFFAIKLPGLTASSR